MKMNLEMIWLKGSAVSISYGDLPKSPEELVSFWGLLLLALCLIIVSQVQRIWKFLLKKYDQSVSLQMLTSIVGPLDKYLSHKAEQNTMIEAQEQTTPSGSGSTPPSSVIDFWDFSDGDRVLVVLPRQARQIEADGGLEPLDARTERLSDSDLENGDRYTLLTELLPGELNAGTNPGDSQITLRWSGSFRDHIGQEYQVIVEGKNQVNQIEETEINERGGGDSDGGGYYRFDNIECQEDGEGVRFVADMHTNIEKVEEGELEPRDMREFPEHLRSAFQVVISLLREHPADIHLDYCLDNEFSNREDQQENIVVIDIDGCNDVIRRIGSLSCSIGRSEGLRGQIRSSNGEILSNSSTTENGRTIVRSYGMFAHIANPHNRHRSCYVLSGTHPYATIGIAQCIAPIRETHHDVAESCCELINQQFGRDGYFHAISQVEAVNGDIRQPDVQQGDCFGESM
jgi:hypothetical protein